MNLKIMAAAILWASSMFLIPSSLLAFKIDKHGLDFSHHSSHHSEHIKHPPVTANKRPSNNCPECQKEYLQLMGTLAFELVVNNPQVLKKVVKAEGSYRLITQRWWPIQLLQDNPWIGSAFLLGAGIALDYWGIPRKIDLFLGKQVNKFGKRENCVYSEKPLTTILVSLFWPNKE